MSINGYHTMNHILRVMAGIQVKCCTVSPGRKLIIVNVLATQACLQEELVFKLGFKEWVRNTGWVGAPTNHYKGREAIQTEIYKNCNGHVPKDEQEDNLELTYTCPLTQKFRVLVPTLRRTSPGERRNKCKDVAGF